MHTTQIKEELVEEFFCATHPAKSDTSNLVSRQKLQYRAGDRVSPGQMHMGTRMLGHLSFALACRTVTLPAGVLERKAASFWNLGLLVHSQRLLSHSVLLIPTIRNIPLDRIRGS